MIKTEEELKEELEKSKDYLARLAKEKASVIQLARADGYTRALEWSLGLL